MDKNILLKKSTKIIATSAGKIKIAKLKLADIDIDAPPEQQLKKMIARSLIDPALNEDEAAQLDADLALELQSIIMDYNGMNDDMEKMEKN